jgi:hypothetical protein
MSEGDDTGEQQELDAHTNGAGERRRKEVPEVRVLHSGGTTDVNGVADQSADEEDHDERGRGQVHEPRRLEELGGRDR